MIKWFFLLSFYLSASQLFALDYYAQGLSTGIELFPVPNDGIFLQEHAEANSLRPTRNWQTPSYSSTNLAHTINNMSVGGLDFSYHERVKQMVDAFVGEKRSYVEQMIGLSTIYFPYYEEILRKNGLPEDLKYLSVIESGLNPVITSRAGAKGPWQFMPYTGREFHLYQTAEEDQRTNVILATEAACVYLKQLYQSFGSWELALAAYNAGPGRVRGAMRRAGSRDYWKVASYLPKETRYYVPKLIAFMYLMKNPENHNLYPVYPCATLQNTKAIKVLKNISFQEIAYQTGISENIIRFLNQSYKYNRINASTNNPKILILPYNSMDLFKTANLGFYDEDVYAPTTQRVASARPTYIYKYVNQYHKVRSGENLGVIAKKNHCSIGDLKRWNNLSASTIYAGQKILIKKRIKEMVMPEQPIEPIFQEVFVSEEIIEEVIVIELMQSVSPEKCTVSFSNSIEIYHNVGSCETINDILSTYEGTSKESLVYCNNLAIDEETPITPGTSLKIIVNNEFSEFEEDASLENFDDKISK